MGGAVTQALAPWGLRTPPALPALALASQGSRCLKSSFDSFCKNIWARARLLHPLQGSAATATSTDRTGVNSRGRPGAPRSSRGLGLPARPSSFPLGLADCLREGDPSPHEERMTGNDHGRQLLLRKCYIGWNK